MKKSDVKSIVTKENLTFKYAVDVILLAPICCFVWIASFLAMTVARVVIASLRSNPEII